MLRVLDTEGDMDARMLAALMCKLEITEVTITPDDETVMIGVLGNGAIKLVCGSDRSSGAVTLRLLESADVPDESEVMQ